MPYVFSDLNDGGGGVRRTLVQVDPTAADKLCVDKGLSFRFVYIRPFTSATIQVSCWDPSWGRIWR